jgi:hypothetical protein
VPSEGVVHVPGHPRKSWIALPHYVHDTDLREAVATRCSVNSSRINTVIIKVKRCTHRRAESRIRGIVFEYKKLLGLFWWSCLVRQSNGRGVQAVLADKRGPIQHRCPTWLLEICYWRCCAVCLACRPSALSSPRRCVSWQGGDYISLIRPRLWGPRVLRMLSAAPQAQEPLFVGRTHQGCVTAVRWSPAGGDVLASGGEDSVVIVWRLRGQASGSSLDFCGSEHWAPLYMLKGHALDVTAVAWHPSGCFL